MVKEFGIKAKGQRPSEPMAPDAVSNLIEQGERDNFSSTQGGKKKTLREKRTFLELFG